MPGEDAKTERRTKVMNRKGESNVNKLVQRICFRPVLEMLCICSVALTLQSSLWAQAALTCPAYTPPAGPNLALNPDFETVGPCGSTTHWVMGNGNCGTNSAALNWTIHSSNTQTAVSTYWVNTALPIGGQTKMLRIIAAGNESGVFQLLPVGPTAVMVSVWVYVRRGHVALQATAGNTGPTSWNIKKNQWEELRVCTDGTVPVDTVVIYNEDPAGGDFLVDRVEATAIN